MHFITGALLKKHGITHYELKAPWPHISAALIHSPLTREEREKFKLAAGVIKPKFVFKQFDILKGKETPFDYLSLEFSLSVEFEKFHAFAQDLCGEDRVVKYEEHRPHLSLWALPKEDHDDIEKLFPLFTKEAKKYLQPVTPVKISIWDDFEISEIETIAWTNQVKSKYRIR